MRQRHLFIFGLIAMLTLAACGTFAEPVPNSATLSAQNADTDTDTIVAEVPTSTPVPPTPTLAPTEVPTEEPTEEPTEIPTEEPTEAPEEVGAPALSVDEENILFFIQEFSDAGNGERLFTTMINVGTSSGINADWSCNTCHDPTTDVRGVGPGFLSVGARASERVEGYPAELYIYNSIIHPNDYIVEDFVGDLMPTGYAEALSEQDIYDIVAYLMTLQGE
jgi:cytochrome c553